MEISISEQALRFLMSCVFGAVLSLAYDFMRIIRCAFNYSHFVTMLTDGLYVFFTLASFTVYVLAACEGDMRFYLIVGLICGILLYLLCVSKIVMSMGNAITSLIKKIIHIIFFPFLWLLKRIRMCVQKRRQTNGIGKQKEKSGEILR